MIDFLQVTIGFCVGVVVGIMISYARSKFLGVNKDILGRSDAS